MESNFIYIKDNTFLGANGIFGVGFKINLLQKYSQGEVDFQSIHETWTKGFGLLENAVILKNDIYLPSNYDTSNFQDLNFLQEATKEHFKGREYLEHQSYIFFIKPDFDTYLNSTWYNPFKRVKRSDFVKIEEEQELFVQQVRNAVNFIESKKFSNNDKIEFIPLKQNELLAYENFYFSGIVKGFTTNVFTQDREVYTGDKKIGLFSIDNEALFPQYLHDCILDQDFSSNKYKYYKNYSDNFSFNLNFAHIYSQVLFIDPAQRTIHELEKVYNSLYKNRNWNRQNEIASAQIKEVLEELIADDDRRVIRGSVSVMIFEEDSKKFDNQKEAVVDAFNRLDITPHYLSNVNRKKSDFYLNFPTFTPYLNDKQLFKIPLDCACCMTSNTTHYKEDKEGVLFTSRIQNIPVLVDNYFEDKKYGNARNAMLIASTGYGKSTLVNHLIRNYYERGEKTVIIDYGGSYKKLSEFFKNDVAYVTYQEGRALGINIFDLGKGENGYRKLTSEELEKITNYIFIHTGEEHQKIEVDVLKKIVEYYYENELNTPNFHSFYNTLVLLKNHLLDDLNIDKKYFDLEKFLLLTEAFSENGKLGFIYKSDTDKIFEEENTKLITVFEFESATENTIILELLLYLTDVVIDKVILKDRTVRGHIIFDEIAKMYKYKGVLDKVELFYQTVRKKEAEITQVLQTIHQLPENNTAKAIIENTQVLYVLYAQDYVPIQKAFNLSEHALYEMQSLSGKFNGEKPHYSEIWILRGHHHAVYRLELPPEVYWSYQTEGAKNEVLMKYYEEYQDMEKAIQKMIESESQKEIKK